MSANDRCREAAALIRNGVALLTVQIEDSPEWRVTTPLDDTLVADFLEEAADTGPGNWATIARVILGAWRGAGCPGKTADFDPRDWDGEES